MSIWYTIILIAWSNFVASVLFYRILADDARKQNRSLCT